MKKHNHMHAEFDPEDVPDWSHPISRFHHIAAYSVLARRRAAELTAGTVHERHLALPSLTVGGLIRAVHDLDEVFAQQEFEENAARIIRDKDPDPGSGNNNIKVEDLEK